MYGRYSGRIRFIGRARPLKGYSVFDHDVSSELVDTIAAARVADSSSAALTQVKRLQSRLVLGDFQMPDQDCVALSVALDPAIKVVMSERVSCSESSVGEPNSAQATIAIFDNPVCGFWSPQIRDGIPDIIHNDLPGGRDFTGG